MEMWRSKLVLLRNAERRAKYAKGYEKQAAEHNAMAAKLSFYDCLTEVPDGTQGEIRGTAG